jgi:hypothetical protein
VLHRAPPKRGFFTPIRKSAEASRRDDRDRFSLRSIQPAITIIVIADFRQLPNVRTTLKQFIAAKQTGKTDMRWINCFITVTAMLGIFGCSGQLQQLAVETMQNAQVALSSAEAMGAQETAETPLSTAQEMLVTAEKAMNAGDAARAYRLALRAYLHARIATETAIAVREEALVQEAQAQLTLSEQSLAEVFQRLEAIKAEFEALRDNSER